MSGKAIETLNRRHNGLSIFSSQKLCRPFIKESPMLLWFDSFKVDKMVEDGHALSRFKTYGNQVFVCR